MILWLTFLFCIFVGVVHLAARFWIQLRVEDAAWSIAQWAYQHPEAEDPPGSGRLTTTLFDGRGVATIAWSNDVVRVRVESEEGKVAAERMFPMENP